MESNRLTIIPVDKTVYRDQGVEFDLNLDSCNIPADVHALQWYADKGEIEYKGSKQNEPITALPSWALAAIILWEESYAKNNQSAPGAVNGTITN